MRPWQITALILCCGAILVFSVLTLRSDTGDVAESTRVVERILVQKEIAVNGKDGLRGGRGPIGKRGRPGKSIRGNRGPRGVPGIGKRGPRGRAGRAGTSITYADLEKYCQTHACRGPVGANGRDGVNGSDAPPPTQAQIDLAVATYCDAHAACTPPAPPPTAPAMLSCVPSGDGVTLLCAPVG